MRLRPLDGLRGVAALVVVVHHTLLVDPRLARAYWEYEADPSLIGRLLTFTPLHLLWDGPAAVVLFFVLSGFVLAIPFEKADHQPWRVYYPRRMIRLYVPVWAAVALAVALTALVPRVANPALSWWVNDHARELGRGWLWDVTLLFRAGRTNTVVWTLQWEVWFSLLLPPYLWLARACQRVWPVAIVGAIVLSQVGLSIGNGFVGYLPVFLVGLLMSMYRESLPRLSRPAGWLWLAVALLLLNASWWPVRLPFTWSLTVAGAALLVHVVLAWVPAERPLTWRPIAWLGAVSFSLYLVHEPVIVSLAMLGVTNIAVLLPTAIAVSLLVAWAFHRLVERPSLLLSRRVGKRPR